MEWTMALKHSGRGYIWKKGISYAGQGQSNGIKGAEISIPVRRDGEAFRGNALQGNDWLKQARPADWVMIRCPKE